MLQRLSSEDARILALESGAVVGHTCRVIVAERRCVDVAGELRRRLEARLGDASELRRRLVETPLGLAGPAWVDDPDFDPAAQIVAVKRPGPASREELARIVAERMAERLDRSRPLWRIDVVDLEDDLVAAIWRIHHALADGGATIKLGEAAIWEPSPGPPGPRDPPPAPAGVPGQLALAGAAVAEHGRRAAAGVAGAARAIASRRRWHEVRAELAAARPTLHRELTRLDGDSPFDAPIGRRRHVAFADLALDDVTAAAHAFDGVTVNDMALALVAGAIRSWLERTDTVAGPLRVQVPVSMHRPHDRDSNRDSFLNVDLPIAEPDPIRRLLAINEETRDRKQQHDAAELYALFTDLGHVSNRLYRRAYGRASDPHVFALSVSNVRGPAEARYLAGGRIRGCYGLAEIAPRHALRVSALSFGGRFSFGLCADADAVPDLDVLAAGLTTSLDELRARV